MSERRKTKLLNKFEYILPQRFDFPQAETTDRVPSASHGKMLAGAAVSDKIGGRRDPAGPDLHFPVQHKEMSTLSEPINGLYRTACGLEPRLCRNIVQLAVCELTLAPLRECLASQQKGDVLGNVDMYTSMGYVFARHEFIPIFPLYLPEKSIDALKRLVILKTNSPRHPEGGRGVTRQCVVVHG